MKKGFTVLFAVLVSSLVLALGLGIAAITLKEVQISGAGRDSQFAFYAADSGAECAFDWDLEGDNFATSSGSVSGTIMCNNQTFEQGSGLTVTSGLQSATSTFTLYMEMNGSNPVLSAPCVVVNVGKDGTSGTVKTAIDSRGYNSCDTANPRRLERGYRITY